MTIHLQNKRWQQVITHQIKQMSFNWQKPRAVETMKDCPWSSACHSALDDVSRWWAGTERQSTLTSCPLGCIQATTVFLAATLDCSSPWPWETFLALLSWAAPPSRLGFSLIQSLSEVSNHFTELSLYPVSPLYPDWWKDTTQGPEKRCWVQSCE